MEREFFAGFLDESELEQLDVLFNAHPDIPDIRARQGEIEDVHQALRVDGDLVDDSDEEDDIVPPMF